MPATSRPIDPATTLAHIGRGNLLAVSGGRRQWELDDETGATIACHLPVAYGYSVRVTLDATDTYIVERVFARNGKSWVKGTWMFVHAEELGEAVYAASCYRD